MNAMSAILACQEYGIDIEDSLEALKVFLGVARRQQLVLENDKVTLIDDFAHHPTAIKATLKGLRDKYKSKSYNCLNRDEIKYHEIQVYTMTCSTKQRKRPIWFME